MDFLTIVGYILAALAIALGLYLMLRKNTTSENTTTATEQAATEQAMLDDADSNIISEHDNGRIPVVPRHVRDQIRQAPSLTTTTTASSAVQSSTNHPQVNSKTIAKDDFDENNFDKNDFDDTDFNESDFDKNDFNQSNFNTDSDLLADAPAIKADRTADSLDDTLNDDHVDQGRNNEATSNPITTQQTQAQVQALAESSKPDQDPVEDTFDQALAQLEAATSADDSSFDDDIEHTTPSSKKSTEPLEGAKDTLATADVEEWQGESALLDAHLEDQERRDDESALAQAEHIVALYVMPNASRALSGERTIQLLRQFGLRYGEMSLFHRFADSDGTGPLMFSVLRYTSEGPSGFDLETLPSEQVEGLAFFLALPSKHAVAGYDTMVSISTLLAREIHGQVYDEHMNQLSPQLREHYRHFVLEYRTPA
ncbi:cell division protein ZipA C-terminal FtsZ-binding domain-containing protein [Alkanindiges illinoisensis]|uniref:cell division protein ZipA C-terminal FtsZ-binding domain-containing protein n=1 Tax=Alkanindiges illinoisensis TaxID=197183 RepID=UPI0006848EF9|nr:cell division protein ZipA C-terminal FtsZ-binding domain-containing protein [Alkanindiges illinoisensis]